jgi:hypothetical protein
VSGWRPDNRFPPIGAGVAAGLLAMGLFPYSAGWRVAAVTSALLLWAGWWILEARVRQGIRGPRGRTRTSAITLAVCALALVPGALSADSAMRLPYVILAGAAISAGRAGASAESERFHVEKP